MAIKITLIVEEMADADLILSILKEGEEFGEIPFPFETHVEEIA